MRGSYEPYEPAGMPSRGPLPAGLASRPHHQTPLASVYEPTGTALRAPIPAPTALPSRPNTGPYLRSGSSSAYEPPGTALRSPIPAPSAPSGRPGSQASVPGSTYEPARPPARGPIPAPSSVPSPGASPAAGAEEGSVLDMVSWKPLPGIVLRSEPGCMTYFYNSFWEWIDCMCWGRSNKTIDLYHYTSTQAVQEIQRTGQLLSSKGSAVSYVTALGVGGGDRLDTGVYFTRLEPQDVAVIVNNNYAGGELYGGGSGKLVEHRHRCAEAVVIVEWPMKRILGRARRFVPDLDAHTGGGLRRCLADSASDGTCAKWGVGASCLLCLTKQCLLGCCLGLASGAVVGRSVLEKCRRNPESNVQSEQSQPWRRPPEDHLLRVFHGKSDVWMVPAAVVELNLGSDSKNEQKRPWGLKASIHYVQNNGKVLVPPRSKHAKGDIRGLPRRKDKWKCAVM